MVSPAAGVRGEGGGGGGGVGDGEAEGVQVHWDNEMFKKTIGDYSTEHVNKDNNIIHKTILVEKFVITESIDIRRHGAYEISRNLRFASIYTILLVYVVIYCRFSYFIVIDNIFG